MMNQLKKVNTIDNSRLAALGKIPGATVSATTVSLHSVKNEIPGVNNLVKKTDYNVKVSDIESQCFTTADYNRFRNEVTDKRKKISSNSDNFGFIDNSDFDKKIAHQKQKQN